MKSAFLLYFIFISQNIYSLGFEKKLEIRTEAPRSSCSAVVAKQCEHFNKIVEKGVDEDLLRQAISFQLENGSVHNQREVLIADYGINSSQKRFYKVDLYTGNVEAAHVSHGSGQQPNGDRMGDRNHDGMVDRCQNPSTKSRENMTRPGFFVTGYPRMSRKTNWVHFGMYNAIPLKGLSEDINTDAQERRIGFNVPTYNTNKGFGRVMGRAHGGPAFHPRERNVLRDMKPGTLYFASIPVCPNDMKRVLSVIPNWRQTCDPTRATTADDSCDFVNNSSRGNLKDDVVSGDDTDLPPESSAKQQ